MSLIVSDKDTLRQSVEASSGGKNTVIFDDKGNPSIMVAIPRFNLSDVIDGAANEPHPAFVVYGEVKDVIYVSKYQNITHDDRAYSLPAQTPRTGITFESAKQMCSNKGSGWHLMTNAEWAALALWSKKNNTLPRGNNNYGADISRSLERGLTATKETDGRTALVKTGTGPSAWSHDGTTNGVYDLNGNIFEWVNGLKVVDGRIVLMQDNNYSQQESAWIQSAAHFDIVNDLLVLNSARTATSGAPGAKFSDLTATGSYAVPDAIRNLAIYRHDTIAIDDMVYVDITGEKHMMRGGRWAYGANAGVFSYNLNAEKLHVSNTIGFRSVYIP